MNKDTAFDRIAEITRLLEAAPGPLSTRQIYDQSGLFDSTTQVSQAIHHMRSKGLLITEIEDGERQHRLASADEHAFGADQPAPIGATPAGLDVPQHTMPQPARRKTTKTKPKARPAATPAPVAPAAPVQHATLPLAEARRDHLAALAGSARNLVNDYVAALGDPLLHSLIELERQTCQAAGVRHA